MTEPDDDVTRLSSRKRGGDDATRLSAREPVVAAEPEPEPPVAPPGEPELLDDATLLSARNSAAAGAVREPEDATLLSARQVPAPEIDDDGTRLSPRLPAPDVPASDVSPDDETRVSRRPGAFPSTPHSRGAKPPLSALPPGVIGGAAAERGAFGLPPTEYETRELPEDAPQPRAAATALPIPAATAPDARRVRSRREASRHRKLITTVIVVAATAALMTAAVIAIVALLSRGA